MMSAPSQQPRPTQQRALHNDVRYHCIGGGALNDADAVHVLVRLLFECPICRAVSPHPMKVLPHCLHRICLSCLRDLVETTAEHDADANPQAGAFERALHAATLVNYYMQCPLCRNPLTVPHDALDPTQTIMTCRASEEFGAYVAFPCLNPGCSEVSQGLVAWRAHAASCEHELVSCPHARPLGCQWAGTRRELRVAHAEYCLYSRCLAAPYCRWENDIMVAHDRSMCLGNGGDDDPGKVAACYRQLAQEHFHHCPVVTCLALLLDAGAVRADTLGQLCPRLQLLVFKHLPNPAHALAVLIGAVPAV